ncbi:trypsin-like serine protease [Corynebacterium guaraldiae]|uniref:trypsin-like serine protease n=1 Tax=Corynebacterium guaraldiae TaxID=3051103 RepID=UPI0024B3A49D|nr:trypsin-like serine protease [Corynebacterium guaraldiae]
MGVDSVPEAASRTSEYTTMTPAPPQMHTPDASPVPPGAALDISAMQPVPGEAFDFNLCTVAWSFVLDDARTIAVTASHCGEPGDTVWAGAEDREFVYPAEPVGTIIYSDLSSPDTHQLDFALVEITRQAEFYVPQDMPTSVVAAGQEELPDEVCKLGRITGETCGPLTHGESHGKLQFGDRTLDTVSASARVCSTHGDSGAPVFGAPGSPFEGVIVGVLSGTTEAAASSQGCTDGSEAEMSFTAASDIEALLPEILERV